MIGPRETRTVPLSSVKISTYGERAVDVFYVKDVFGLKIEHEQKLRKIHEHHSGLPPLKPRG